MAMTSMPETEVHHIIEETLQDAGVELDELRRQYTLGRFESDKLRRTWFVVAGLGRA